MRIDSKNSTMLWGLLLIALGSFFFLQATGILGVLSSLFWTLIFAAAGSVFLYFFLTGLHDRGWAAIPGCTLMGLAAESTKSGAGSPAGSGCESITLSPCSTRVRYRQYSASEIDSQ